MRNKSTIIPCSNLAFRNLKMPFIEATAIPPVKVLLNTLLLRYISQSMVRSPFFDLNE